MTKRNITVPPLYVQKHEWTKNFTTYCLIMFVIFNILGYVYYKDDVSKALINPAGLFAEQCNDDYIYENINDDVIKSGIVIDIDVIGDGGADIHLSIDTHKSIDHDKMLSKYDMEINRKYCGKSDCKFLFAYYQPEQETKANMHYRSFVNLARALDRVMVLTNVGNSRINSCQNFTFDLYYDVDEVQNMFPDVKFITQQDFQNWLSERQRKPNTEHAYILPGNTNQSMEYVTPYPEILKTKHCLNRFDFTLDDNTVFKQFNTGPKFTKDIIVHQNFANFLTENLVSDVDVLLTAHFVFHPLFPNVTPPMPYAKYFFDEAEKISRKLQPYIAVHWRMERASLKKLDECSVKLVEKINEIKLKHGIENVYLATDYPISGGEKTQSSTFHLLTDFHHDAMRYLNSSVNLNNWVTMDVLGDLRQDMAFESEFVGAGMSGIVDKLICINSNYFLATPEGCGRERSTFTTMITDERNSIMISKNKGDLNSSLDEVTNDTDTDSNIDINGSAMINIVERWL